MPAELEAENIPAGLPALTTACVCGITGCECKANWTYAGETWQGCANPGNNWPSAWCYVDTTTCLPGAWACAIEQGLWCAALPPQLKALEACLLPPRLIQPA